MSDGVLAKELRDAANRLREVSKEARCYSVIQDIVANACDHIDARARIVEANQRDAINGEPHPK